MRDSDTVIELGVRWKVMRETSTRIERMQSSSADFDGLQLTLMDDSGAVIGPRQCRREAWRNWASQQLS